MVACLNGFPSLTARTAADGTRDMQAMGSIGGAVAGPAMGMGPQPNYTKLFAAEAESLELVDHRWLGEDVEGRLLRAYGYDVL